MAGAGEEQDIRALLSRVPTPARNSHRQLRPDLVLRVPTPARSSRSQVPTPCRNVHSNRNLLIAEPRRSIVHRQRFGPYDYGVESDAGPGPMSVFGSRAQVAESTISLWPFVAAAAA